MGALGVANFMLMDYIASMVYSNFNQRVITAGFFIIGFLWGLLGIRFGKWVIGRLR